MSRKERRRATRTYSNVPLDLYDAAGRVIIGEGRFINVSMTGSLMQSRRAIPLRQRIRLQVQSPAQSPFEFAGRVVWRKKTQDSFTYGIRFERISAAHLLARSSTSSYAHATR
jgi:hypothetical protein